jgi:hypothetical protein
MTTIGFEQNGYAQIINDDDDEEEEEDDGAD